MPYVDYPEVNPALIAEDLGVQTFYSLRFCMLQEYVYILLIVLDTNRRKFSLFPQKNYTLICGFLQCGPEIDNRQIVIRITLL